MLCGKEEYTEGVEEVQHEKEGQIKAEQRQQGLRSTHTSGGQSKGGEGGCQECRIHYRSDNPDRGAPVGIEERG